MSALSAAMAREKYEQALYSTAQIFGVLLHPQALKDP